jgi:hypothetical protein
MVNSFGRGIVAAAAVALGWPAPASAQVMFTGNYAENFNSMGAGATPPTGWQVFQVAGASSTWTHNTGSNSVPAIGAIPDGTAVAGGTPSTGLVVNDNPTGNEVQGYNATGASGAAGDRGIATAPTGIAGSVIELQLTNNSGLAQTGLTVGYDIRRYQAGADNAGRSPPPGIPEGSEELPGYWLFYSLDGGATYTGVPALIPVGEGPTSQPVVPNTVGVTTVPATQFNFGGTWNAGSPLFLRWVDDNAIDPSPDQIIGLDNVSVSATPVPEPSSLLSVAAVGLLAGARAARRRSRARPARAAA